MSGDQFQNEQSLAMMIQLMKRDAPSYAGVIADRLGRVEVADSRIGAFTHIAHEHALLEARRLDHTNARNNVTMPLAGVPIAVKEVIAVEGQPTTAGSVMDISDLVPPQGPFIKRLRDAGAIVIGKTVSTEFALSYQNLTLKTPHNPLYTKPYTPGGSSSGAAVAVAAGLCAFAVGTDTGGSIRVPAAFCGVTGFKPGTEFWSRDGMIPLSRELDTIGLITRSPNDLVTILESLGHGIIPHVPLGSFKLGLPEGHFYENLDPAVSSAVNSAINRIVKSGAQITRIVVPDYTELNNFAQIVNSATLVRFLGRERIKEWIDKVDPVTRLRFDAGLAADMFEVQTLVENRRTLANRVKSNLAHIDAIITPTTPNLPIALSSLPDAETIAAWQAMTAQNVRFANLFNFAAISIPLPGDQPIGLQLMASGGSESKLASIAAAVQQALDN
jgi:aspartyl-tRNA(Asn)/glutamyl-tRNA(Gln) amidotransferase subunit A